MEAAGHRFVVPAIADYEVRRELVRAGRTTGIARLNQFIAAEEGRLLSVTDSALQLGAEIWARVRNSGLPTADPKELDGDVLIAAQVLDVGLAPGSFVIATTNVSHLSRFVPAELWSSIRPRINAAE